MPTLENFKLFIRNSAPWLKEDGEQTQREELVNALIHSVGILLSVAALIVLILQTTKQENTYKLLSGIIFASSSILTYSASVLYHGCSQPVLKRHFRLFDHLTIYYLIAGSYTPFTLITLHAHWGKLLFISIWSLALLGTFFKLFFINMFENLSIAIYLIMGWLSLLVIKPLWNILAFAGFIWLVAGGLLYTLGIYFYRKDHLYYSHAIWHLFVLAGTACHFLSIFFYVLN